MMSRASIIGILSAAALAGCATVPSHTAPRTASATPPGWCTTAQGKALQPGSSGCDAVDRTYSGKQLRETGMTDVARALGMLDPDVTVHSVH